MGHLIRQQVFSNLKRFVQHQNLRGIVDQFIVGHIHSTESKALVSRIELNYQTLRSRVTNLLVTYCSALFDLAESSAAVDNQKSQTHKDQYRVETALSLNHAPH